MAQSGSFISKKLLLITCISAISLFAQTTSATENDSYSPPPMFGGSQAESTTTTKFEKKIMPSPEALLKADGEEEKSIPGAKILMQVTYPSYYSVPANEKSKTVKNVPAPPKKYEMANAANDIPIPERRPDVPSYKTSRQPSNTYTMILQRPSQADVPNVPAVPAVKVKREVLYSAYSKTEQEQNTTLRFKKGEAVLTGSHQKNIDSRITKPLNSNDSLKIVITAFASAADDTTSSAKRISLSRALSVRSYLVDKGIDPGRIELHALGDKTEDTPVDRIELAFSSLTE